MFMLLLHTTIMLAMLQVIDMGLVLGETVLGARLLDGNATTYYLLLLTQSRLILHTLVPSSV